MISHACIALTITSLLMLQVMATGKQQAHKKSHRMIGNRNLWQVGKTHEQEQTLNDNVTPQGDPSGKDGSSNRQQDTKGYQGPECDKGEQIGKLPLCWPKNYEKHVRPDKEKATEVKVHIGFSDVEEINDQLMNIKFHLHITLSWSDPRLEMTKNFNETSSKDNDSSDGDESIEASKDKKAQEKGESRVRIIDPDLLRKFWIPDVTIRNLIDVQYLHMLKQQSTLKVYENKTVVYSFAARLNIGCKFYFAGYPLDNQQCLFQLGSNSYTNDEMTFSGSFYHPYERQRPLPMTFDLVKLTENETVVTMSNEGSDVEQTFSFYGFKIICYRQVLGFIFRTYLPATMLVFVSWVSFMIEQKQVTGRLALLVVLTLTLINIFNAIMDKAPATSSTSAIEIYVMACLVSVALALMEFAFVVCNKSPIVKQLAKKLPDEKLKSLTKKIADNESDSEDSDNTRKQKKKARAKHKVMHLFKKSRKASQKYFDPNYIDSVSCCLFPMLFFIFAICYWSYFLYLKMSVPPDIPD